MIHIMRIDEMAGRFENESRKCIAEISGLELDSCYYDGDNTRAKNLDFSKMTSKRVSDINDITEDEFLNAYHLGYGNEEYVIDNLVDYSIKAKCNVSKMYDDVMFDHLVENSYETFENDKYIAIVDDNDYNPHIYIFEK